MTRRERAIERCRANSFVAPRSTSANYWVGRGVDAALAELAADLESEETVQRIAEMVWGRFPKQPPYVTEAQTCLVRDALRSLLEDR